MATGDAGSASTAQGATSELVPNQLALLVPSFDPSKDSLEIWTQKVELLVSAWPPSKLSELATRLILNTTGSAFQKLQLHKDELVKNDPKAIKLLVSYLGGQWGKVPLEQRFDAAEKALFRCVQRQDESNDSYLARADVLWSELLAKNMSLAELRAYIVLRGSLLPSEDKKRVLVESGAEVDSSLSLDRVSRAIRMLGAGFFQDYAGMRRQKLKTYDHQVLMADDDDLPESGVHHTVDDDGMDEQSFFEHLAQEGDSDALLISEYEAAMSDTLQDDPELASCYNAYADARYRLSERFRSRGFWPIKGKNKGGKSTSKGKGGRFGKDRKSLEQRILSSYCRKCGQKGHWKSECPNISNSFSSDGRNVVGSTPTASTSYVEVPRDGLPLEFMQLPSVQESPLDVSRSHPVHEVFMGLSSVNITRGNCESKYRHRSGVCYLCHNQHDDMREQQYVTQKMHALTILRKKNQSDVSSRGQDLHSPGKLPSPGCRAMHPRQHNLSDESECRSMLHSSWEEVNFASYSSYGVVDLGASKTVIGSQCLKELIQALPKNILQKCYRTPCVINFRFGNQGMLTSEWAFVVPLSPQLHLKIAVVSGATPFLLSSALLRAIGAVIDTSKDVLWCRRFHCAVSLHLTDRGLFLLDMKELLQKAWQYHSDSTTLTCPKQVSTVLQPEPLISTSETVQKKGPINHGGPNESFDKPISSSGVELCHFLNEEGSEKNRLDGSKEGSGCASHLDGLQDANRCLNDDKIFQPQGVPTNVRVETPSESPSHVVARSSTQGSNPGTGGSTSGSTIGRVGESSTGVWTEARGKEVLSHLGDRSGVDQLVSGQVCQVAQTDSSDLRDVCREEARRDGGHRHHSAQDYERGSEFHVPDSCGSDLCQTSSQEQRISGKQEDTNGDPNPRLRGGGVRHGGSIDDDVFVSTTGCGSFAGKDAAHGECPDPDHAAHPEAELSAGELPDWQLYAGDADHEFALREKFGCHSHERKIFQHLVQKYTTELQAVKQSKNESLRSHLCLLEVFCGPNSQLTRQAIAAGLKAERFGLDQGDLSTQEGRIRLFQLLCSSKPEHLWFSPECRPWSAWSAFNSCQSLEAWDRTYQDRLKGLEQVALGLVLFRFQSALNRHFHWEQPSRSMMFRLPFMQEVFSYTKMIECDLCEVGDLRDPISHQHIKKGLLICTTSKNLFEQFHGRRCRHDHPHQSVEGSVHWQGQRISRSRYTENYPRKFARQIAQLWKKQSFPREKPFSDPIFAAAASASPEEVSPPLKRRRLRATPPKAPHMIEVSELPCVKRRKTDKQPDHAPSATQAFAEVCRKVDERTPRVGKRRFTEQDDIIKELQPWFPDKQLVVGLSCRGTDRLQAPPKDLISSETPWRKTICVHRHSGKIVVTKDWEEWGTLSQRQLIRAGCPARLSITVFARNPLESVKVDSPPMSSGPAVEPLHVPPTPEGTGEDGTDRVSCDVASQQHGPRFCLLPATEREVIIKCHRNLGHVSAERLKILMKQQGFRPEAIDAVDDFRCSTCLENQAPRISRPAAMKDSLDFNDRVSMDGVAWKNKDGNVFHFYHLIDHGTSFHSAAIAPNRTTSSVIEFLGNFWISWAGAPAELLVDSAGEFNSHEIDVFCQGFNIRKSTTCPEAHWQNGRAERHGEILQQMLNKYQEDVAITNYHDLQQALWHCIQAKNACSLRRGFAPEVLVLGKHTRLPGSICGDEQIASHTLAESDVQQGQLFRENLAKREAARKAFWAADNHSAIRRAILRRTRPSRGHYNPGEWIMMWKKTDDPKGKWIGPAKVITQEGTQTVWCTLSGRLFRCSPEQVRPVSAFEARQISSVEPQTERSVVSQLQEVRAQNNAEQFQDLSSLTEQNHPEEGTGLELQQDTPSEHPSVSQPDFEPEAHSNESSVGIDSDPVNVPVPEGSDSELVTQALVCIDDDAPVQAATEDQLVWRFELTADVSDIQQWQNDSNCSDAFLVTAAKKQRVEVKLHELSKAEQEEMRIAKESEIKNWISTQTVEKLLRDKVDPSQIMKCRWVLTWKPLDEEARLAAGDPHKFRKAKARLVVLGFMDPSLDSLQRDSPTMSRLSRMMVLQLIASKRWTLFSFDIRTAFLQGQPQKDRLLAIEPVPELSQAMQLKRNEICKLTKSAYGLVDAPFLWYQALKKRLLQLSFEDSPFDPCVFILRHPQSGEPEGILGTHVDDGLGGGNQRFEEKIKELEATFPFGSRRTGKFTFTGIDLQQHADKSISLSQSSYVKNIVPIGISPERRKSEESDVDENEKHALRALVGSLQYASVNTRPDLASRLSFLQSAISKAKVSDLVEGNRVLHEAKREHDLSILIKSIPCSDLRFLAFSDASFASAKNPDAHAGCIILATHKEIGQNASCPISPLSWGSKKIQRVVVSTLAAETMAMSSTLDQLSWLRLCWGWMLQPSCNWRKPEQALKELPESFASATFRAQQLPSSLAVTDCKSLYDLVTRAAPPNCQEFRTMLHARSIKELIGEGVSLRWVHSGAQLADSLTKVMESSFLRETIRGGHYKLHDELEVLKARSNSRNRLKWLRSEGCQDACFLQNL